MYVLVIQMECHLPGVRSLKGKRAIKNRLIQGMRSAFSLAIAEVDKADNHQSLSLGITTVSGDLPYLQNLPQTLRDFVEERLDGTITTFQWECFRWE